MPVVEYSNHWFCRVPSELLEWADFFMAIKYEVQELITTRYIGSASVYVPEVKGPEWERADVEDHTFALTFAFRDDETLVYWADEFIGADEFTVNHDLSWAYDPDDMGKLGELPLEISSWLDKEENVAGKVAVLAVAVARAWLRNPPNRNARMAFEVQGPWVD